MTRAGKLLNLSEWHRTYPEAGESAETVLEGRDAAP